MIFPMKQWIFALATVAFLAGCGASDETQTADAVVPDNFFQVEKPLFRLNIPENWQEVSATEFFGKSFSGSVLAAFRALESENGIFSNVVITTEKIPRNFSALEFSDSLMENLSGRLFGFSKISETPLTISGQNSKITEFLGSSESDKPPMRFWQVSFVRDGTGVVATGGSAQDAESAPEMILTILKSFTPSGDVAKR